MVLYYFDNVLAISSTPMKTIEVIKAFNGDKAEVYDMYLGASIQKVEAADDTECLSEEEIPGNAPPI